MNSSNTKNIIVSLHDCVRVCMRVCVRVLAHARTSVCTQKQASARVHVRGRLSVCTCDFVCHACVYNVINHLCHFNKHL